LRRSGRWISTAALACLLWVCVASALFAPWWGVVLIVAVWGCALVVLGWARPYPARTVYGPLAGALVWFAIAVGLRWWVWSA